MRKGQFLWQGVFITGIIVVIAFCEYVFTYRNVAYGIILCLGLTLLLYLVLVIRPLEDVFSTCIESITLIPLYVLFTSSLPWFFIKQDYLLPAVYSCIIALCMFHIYHNDIEIKNVLGHLPSRERLFQYLLLGIVIGICTGMLEFLILKVAPVGASFSIKDFLRNLCYMLFFVGFGEELLFRALIQRELSRLFGWKWGLAGASILFSIMHIGWRSVPELFFVFFAGLVFGMLYYRTKSLFLPVVVHGVNNTVLVAVYPYLIR